MVAPPAAARPRKATRLKAAAILEGAAALIAEKGFEATAIRDVGRRLEVSLGGMYYHFSGKDELLFQIQHRTFRDLLAEQTRRAAEAAEAPDRLRRLLVGHLQFFERHPNEMKVCTYELESLKGELYQKVLGVRRRYYQLVAGVVAEVMGVKAGDQSRHTTLFVFGMLNWSLTWYRPAKDGPVEALAEEMLSLVLHGVGQGKAGR
ncbi:MAG: TetR/AcrR family transcriptional regulator [Gemmatimonadales bacterium]